ncbi:MAG: hypothetical protein A2847_02775 [Candidatus Sungbacteria bacterium RIFCSPHIGHO2_01_FULL_50_25]|uniref:Peptidoglycan binding-like domain-containing protein n=1 Tax=Candidatus Sungbacteria bacterium RIFCSPHIGHO2_01_FULL_50_25 TaxID=1802265 RepID=A0A1G2KC52_9BACT|nr:MAG: hypothetical protein A2847_02775 [Candidatus Sungbacteria bacterium RIFCSPHIGHO2_01_FULL_50_25]
MSNIHKGYGGFKAKFATMATVVALSGVTAFVPVVAQGASLTQVQIDTFVALLQSFGVDAATIANVKSSLTGGPVVPAPSPAGKCSFTRNLSQGVSGDDVKCLQQYLNSAGHQVSASGAGSPGSETTYFGAKTKAAVGAWQAANGVAPTAGYFGSISRAKYDALMAAGPVVTPPPGPGPVPSGSGLTVSAAADQPAASLAPEKGARVPFTKVVLSASADGDITVNSITVERQGLLDDTAIDGVVVLDEAGVQIGLVKTLNASHRATLTEKITVAKGTSKTVMIAANMATDLDQESGQVGRLAVVAVDAGTASVNGLPVVGNSMTVNSTLAIGSLASPTRGSLDPGAARTALEVGSKNFLASSGKWTAGSAEPIMLTQIRWYQAGSAGTGDLKNVRAVINNVEYPATASSDGRYYVAQLGSSIEVDKGGNIEVAIRVDIEGGSDRTIDFDIQRRTDVVVKGKTYGYYITPDNGSTANTSTQGEAFTSTEPYYDGYSHTISKGSLRVEKSNTVPAGNVPVDVSNTTLGAFTLEAKGEAIQITSFKLSFLLSSGEAGTQLDNVSVYNSTGGVVAGPKDVDATTQTTFTDTWTVPVGAQVYTVKGKLTTDFEDSDTVQVSIDPDADITAKGEVTGLSVTASPTSSTTANTQTVKRASLRVAIGNTPSSQNVVRGVNGFHFATVQYDATDSGEDLRITTQKLGLTPANGGSATDINSCKLFDGTTALTTGSNAVEPDESTANTEDALTFNMDGTGFIIPKGSTKNIDVKCNISNTPLSSETFRIGLTSTNSDTTVAGKDTGVSVTESVTLNTGSTMTIKTGGALSVTLDASSPTSERYGIAGKADVLLGVLKVHATDEAIVLERIALTLSSSTASTSDLTNDNSKMVSLWDGATKVGTAVFQGSETRATSTLSTSVIVPKDGDKVITIKGDLATLGVSLPATRGHLVAVNYDGEAVTTTRGIGQSSGNQINPSTSTDTAGAGVRLVQTYPTLERLSVPSNTLANGEMTLYRFKVTADAADDLGLARVTFRVSSTSVATTSAFKLFAYTDSGFSTNAYAINPVHSRASIDVVGENIWNGNEGTVADSEIVFYFNPVANSNPGASLLTHEALNIPLGASRYFELRGTLSGVTTGDSITVALLGDASFASNTNLVNRQTADAVDTATHDDFIWSPNTTSTSATTTNDWLNGFQVPGLPSIEMSQQNFTK